MNHDPITSPVTNAVKAIWQAAIDLYERHGFSATVTLGEALGLPSSRCEPCDNDTATLQGACLSCGSSKPDNNE